MLPVFGGISGSTRTTLNTIVQEFRRAGKGNWYLISSGSRGGRLKQLFPAFLLSSEIHSLLATNFSSFTTSAANLRMPSESFSVAMAFSFNNHRNLFSSSSNFSTLAAFAFSRKALTLITLGHAVLIGILGLGVVQGVRAIITDRKQPNPASSPVARLPQP